MSDIDFSGFDLVLEESAKDRMTVNERVLTPLIHNRLFEVFSSRTGFLFGTVITSVAQTGIRQQYIISTGVQV